MVRNALRDPWWQRPRRFVSVKPRTRHCRDRSSLQRQEVRLAEKDDGVTLDVVDTRCHRWRNDVIEDRRLQQRPSIVIRQKKDDWWTSEDRPAFLGTPQFIKTSSRR
jgi:hypothetical protein